MRTSDPEIGAREIGHMPTLRCEDCEVLYWDSEVKEALNDITRSSSPKEVREASRGSVCPECGHEQEN